MIYRIWRGRTTPENADRYQQFLLGKLMPDLAARDFPGPRESIVLRRVIGTTFEFMTVMTFDDLAAVQSYAGEDYERAVVPQGAQGMLQDWDDRSAHFEVIGRFAPGNPVE